MTAQPRLLGGRYQVGELLGYGGMAEVHRGRDLRLGRDVAIKMLRTDLARDATFQMRFRREAQNAASLNHPAIVAVYDTGEERAPTGEALPYIVMEYVNGRTLKEVLVGEGRLMPRRALEITADVCSALEFSHRHGIIHRDIKPGNIMLNHAGQVKVMDFGIARALTSTTAAMTQTSAVIGTAQYLSPEQARGESVDARSDVYATGCVLYELLTGQPPFVGDNPVSVAYQHVREDPRPPSHLNPDVTPDIDAVVLKALAKNPANRYQSAAEMRADLLRAASGRPVYATPVLPPEEMMTAAPTRVVPAAARTGPRTSQMARVNARRRRTTAWVVALLSALGVLAVTALVAALILANRTEMVTVPKVIDLPRDQAEQMLQARGLRVGKWENNTGADCTLNAVTDQRPGPDQRVEKNTEVILTVCVGPNMTTVPDVVGQSWEIAKANLEGRDLNPILKEVDSEKPKGEVIKTDPPADTSVPVKSEVTVEVSKGNKKAVPDVAGMTPEEAKERLEREGFKVRLQVDESARPNQAGKVTGTDPEAGTVRIPSETTVTVFYGKERTEPSPTPSPSQSTQPPEGG